MSYNPVSKTVETRFKQLSNCLGIKKSTLILRWREFNLPKIARLFVLSQGEKLISLLPP